MKSDRILNKFKARLVAGGYSPIHGQIYFETFSPTVSLENVRMILALAARYDGEAHQVDVKNVLGELGLYEAGGGWHIFTDSKGAEALVGKPV